MSKSGNIEIMIHGIAGEVLEETFQSLISRCLIELKRSMESGSSGKWSNLGQIKHTIQNFLKRKKILNP